mgnify:CR=1 FL=1
MFFFFFQAEDGIRDLVRSRGLGDVYKRQPQAWLLELAAKIHSQGFGWRAHFADFKYLDKTPPEACGCLLYTSDAADDLLCVDLGGRRIIKKKKKKKHTKIRAITITK